MHVIRGLAIPFRIYCIAAIYPIHRLVNTATTVAAGAFIASSMTLGGAVVDAAINSSSVEEFMDNGNWGTVAATAFGGAIGAGFGYLLDRQQYPNPNKSSGSVTSSPCDGTATCFVAGTLIATKNGSLPIEQITAGMMVYTTDPDTGETALKPVVRTFRNTTTEWVHITVNDETLTCTPEHPFYSPVKGWTSAVDLRAGDILVMLNGEYVVVEQVQHELLESPETTYNFEVKDFHTYYVGEDQILVHNKCSKYYKATRTDDGVMQGAEITKKQALNRIRSGKDVIANSRSAAKSLAKNAFGNSKVYSEIHPKVPNAMYHFHDDMNHIFHVFFK